MVSSDDNESQFWIPISDLMSGMMIIFMFISIASIIQISGNDCGGKSCKDVADSLQKITIGLDSTNKKLTSSVDTIQKITATFRTTRNQIISAVKSEIGLMQLKRWNMEFDTNRLAFVFKNKNFESGRKHNPVAKFKSSLEHFFPKLSNILLKNIDEIQEVKIEGYCSKDPGNSRIEEYQNTYLRAQKVLEIWINKIGTYKGQSKENSKLLLQKTKLMAHGATELIDFDNKNNVIMNCNEDSCRRVEIVIVPKFEEVLINTSNK